MDPNDRPKPPPFQMVRSLAPADFLTLGNAACGVGAVLLCLHGLDLHRPDLLLWAMAMTPLAFIFDALDGAVARKTRRSSPYGGDLDSLADTISFGVAPAVIGFSLGLRGAWDSLILIYFVCCGIGRLARFNVTADDLATESGKVAYFEGTPIPTSISIVLILFIAAQMGATNEALWLGAVQFAGATLHPLSVLYAASGSLMISTIRVPKP